MIAEKTKTGTVDHAEVYEALFRQIDEWVNEENKTLRPKQRWEVFRSPQENPERSEIDMQTIVLPKSKTLPSESSVIIWAAGIQYDGKFVVDMRSRPSYIPIRLLNTPGSETWEMETEAGIPFYYEWNRANFIRMIRDITATH